MPVQLRAIKPLQTPISGGSANRLAFVDALRGLAILGVILVHVSQMNTGIPDSWARIAAQGRFGVQLFFIASAFTLLLSMAAHNPDELSPIRNFFIRRIFRIVPLFYCGMVFYPLLYAFFHRSDDITLFGFIATATFINGWFPEWINRVVPGGWSIAVEMTFYLLLPVFYRRIRSLASAIIFACLSIISCIPFSLLVGNALRGFYPQNMVAIFIELWLPAQIPIFLFGCIFYHLYRLRQRTAAAGPRVGAAKWQAVSLIALAGYILWATSQTGSNPLLPTHILCGAALILVAYALSIHSLCLFVNPVMVYIGKASYSGYITHFVVIDLVSRVLRHLNPRSTSIPGEIVFLVTFGCVVALTTVVSTLTYKLIELPGQKLGRRIIAVLECRDRKRLQTGSEGTTAGCV
jgi:peptidoglycan/LPS O-acetylase OafA/YrhL